MARRSLQIFGYILALIIVVGGARILIAYGNGYTYDFKTGQLIHRGLIILGTNPSGANITLNGKKLHQKTTYHENFRAGWYNFTLSKDGYRTWNKRVEAVPSQVTLVQYVILLPQQLVSKTVITRPTLTQFTASPDRRHIAFVVPSGDDAGVWSLDPGNGRQTKLYASTPASATAGAESDTILDWADDSSRLLISSHTDSGTADLVVPASGSGQPINLTSAFGVTAGSVRFNASNAQQLYWESPDGLRRIDTGNQTISDILVAHEGGYTFAGDRIIYVDTTTGRAPSLWSLDGSGHTQRLVAKLAPSQAYNLDYVTYNGTSEAAVVAQDSHSVVLYSNVLSEPSAVSIPASATRAKFSGSGRFVLLSDDQHVATYDLQYERTYAVPAPYNAVTGLTWFDNFHLLYVHGSDVVLSEFDGNYATVVAKSDGQTPYGTSGSQDVTATAATSSGAIQVKSVKIR